jgi:GDP-L-fucose synthase
MIDRGLPLLVTGASGMIGTNTRRLLASSGFTRVLAPTRGEVDLADARAVDDYFERSRPAHVLMLAAKVGGIAANVADPVGFTDENLRIALNLFSSCLKYGSKKNLFLGSSCIYPLGQADLIPEGRLLTGPLEPTNEGYALSKIVGLKLARYYLEQHGLLTVCPMLSNVYGTGDHFDFGRAHVLSSIVRRFVDARESGASSVTLWGTGVARREFLHAEDAARAILFFIDNVETAEHINVGIGADISIRDLAARIAEAVGYSGETLWDASKPDGMPRKCLDISRLTELGFLPRVGLDEGIRRTIVEYESIKHRGQLIA